MEFTVIYARLQSNESKILSISLNDTKSEIKVDAQAFTNRVSNISEITIPNELEPEAKYETKKQPNSKESNKNAYGCDHN